MDAKLSGLRAVSARHEPQDVFSINKTVVKIKKYLFGLMLYNVENDLDLFAT